VLAVSGIYYLNNPSAAHGSDATQQPLPFPHHYDESETPNGRGADPEKAQNPPTVHNGPKTSANRDAELLTDGVPFDMVNWVTQDATTAQGHMESYWNSTWYLGHVNWATAQKYWYIKAPTGNPWDVMIYDSKYIYLWATEAQCWTCADSYKKMNPNTSIIHSPRYPVPGFPGARVQYGLAQTTTPPPGTPTPTPSYTTTYDIYAPPCTYTGSSHTKVNIAEVWGPYSQGSFGGDFTNVSYVVVKTYGYCNQYGTGCTNREDFVYAHNNVTGARLGWIQWTQFVPNDSGGWSVKTDAAGNPAQITYNKFKPNAPPKINWGC
jgi:hypothetical protein